MVFITCKRDLFDLTKAVILLGAPFRSLVTRNAANQGHLNILTYAIENGCAWHADAMLLAVNQAHLSVVSFALQKNAPATAETLRRARILLDL